MRHPSHPTHTDLLVPNGTESSLDGMWVRLTAAQQGGQHSCGGTVTGMCQPTDTGEQKQGRAPAQQGFQAPQKLCKKPTWERDGRQPNPSGNR